MTMNKRYLIALFLCAACTLSGCGGEQPPDTYSAAEDSLPSLTALVSPAGDLQCTQQTEDGAVSYRYTGLDDTVQAVTDYRQALETDYACVPLSAQGQRLPEDEALSDEGELILACESDTGSGLFQLDVTWDQDSCTVSPSYDASGTLPEADTSMTNAEAVEYFSALPPASLGLSGDTMAAYSVFCEDGQVLLDGVPCLCLNIYQSGRYQASYLFSPADRQIYRLDRTTEQVTPLTP